jgi:hypothetical protein
MSAPVIAGAPPAHGLRPLIYSLCSSLPGLVVLWGDCDEVAESDLYFLVLPLIVVGLWLEIACDGGLQGNGSGNGWAGTPSGTYTMTVSATVSSLPQQTPQVQVTLTRAGFRLQASGSRLLPSHFQLLASGFWHPARHGFHSGIRTSGTLAPYTSLGLSVYLVGSSRGVFIEGALTND